MEEKDAVTAVQTLRNALIVVALMSQAAAYIGARALPDVLLSSEYTHSLAALAVSWPCKQCGASLMMPACHQSYGCILLRIWTLCAICLARPCCATYESTVLAS